MAKARGRRLNKRLNPGKRPGGWLETGAQVLKAAKHGYGAVQKLKSFTNAQSQTYKKSKNKSTQTQKSVTVKSQPGAIITHSKFAPKLHHSKVNKIHRTLSNLLHYETIQSAQLLTTDDTTDHRQMAIVAETLWTGVDYGAVVNTAFDNLGPGNPFFGYHPGTEPLGGDRGMKVLLEGCTSEIEMMNQTEGSVMLWVYNLVANTNALYEDPLTTWATALTLTASSPAVIGTTGTRNFPNMDPRTYKQFNAIWKTERKTMVHLTPGQSHRHKSFYKLNRLTDYSYFTRFTMVKGITRATVIVGRGQVGDNTLGMKGLQVVSYAPVKIDMTIQHKYKTRILSSFPSNYYYLNGLGTVTYDEDVATDHLYINNPDTGTVTDTHDQANIA